MMAQRALNLFFEQGGKPQQIENNQLLPNSKYRLRKYRINVFDPVHLYSELSGPWCSSGSAPNEVQCEA